MNKGGRNKRTASFEERMRFLSEIPFNSNKLKQIIGK
jgi:hypothetical protein